MSARAKKPTDLPVKVGVNLDLKSRPLPVVVTAIIVAVILVLVVLAVLNPLGESPATVTAPESPATAGTPGSQATADTSAAQITYPLDINAADADALALLPGIGDARARAIVEHREANGAFGSIEDIQNVYGIGPGLFERIKDRIKV